MEEVAAAERNDAEALERIQRAARGDDDALCDAVAAHLRTELEREAPPPALDNTNDFPALPTTKKKRVRATLVTATVPPAPPVATPVKRPSAAASTDASAALGAVVARAARRGDLGATLRLVARAARRGGGGARRLAAEAAAALAPELAALPLDAFRPASFFFAFDVLVVLISMWGQTYHGPSTRPPDRRRCGRAADLARDAGCRDAAAALARRASPRPSPKKQSAAPRDLSVPFDAARDSRLHHRGREQAYALRERCRDRFLDLLRDYEAARRDANRERLFPPADDAFFFRKRRPQRRGARQTRDAFRDRASQVCRAVPPEHVGWFARVFTDILTAAAAAEDVYDEADDAFWAGSPLETVPGQLRIFALFVVGADAKAFSDSLREVLVATLSEDVDADALPRTRVGEALAKRTAGAALLGFLRSAPNFGSSSQGRPRPADLDVVRVLQSIKDASDARAYFVAAWVCAFLAALQFDAASRREDTAIMDELEALRARLACRDPSPALLAARLDVEACLRRLGRPLVSLELSVPAPASPTSPASPRDAWSPRRAPNVADADALRSPAAARAARAWFSAAVSVVSPAKAKTPPKKVTPLLVKPAPAARAEKKAEAASPTATATAARRALLKPVAAAFFRRHPRARDVAQLAVDAAKARCAADPGLDPGREIDARARPALDLLAPPDQPAAVARVAASLARAHFLEDVVPKLASGGSHASL